MEIHFLPVGQDFSFVRRLWSATHRTLPTIGKIRERFAATILHGIVHMTAHAAYHLWVRGSDVLVPSIGQIDKGGNTGVAFFSRFHAKVRERTAHFSFAATVCAGAKNARVCRSETRECVGATIRAGARTRTLASVADLDAQFCERATRLVAAANR